MGERLDNGAAKGWQTVMKPEASTDDGSHFVTGSSIPEMPESYWPPVDHPLYGDDKLVGIVTDWLLDQGRTILQLFLLGGEPAPGYPRPTSAEATHSRAVLARVNAPEGGRVLSLGCGVGGMEAHWHHARTDLRFTLVNASRAQLDRCLCPGDLIYGDMRDHHTTHPLWGTQDIVVMAYSLHHVEDVPRMVRLARRCLKPGGTLLVIDVVDGTKRFSDAVKYEALDSRVLAEAGLVRNDHFLTWQRLPEAILGSEVCSILDAGEVTPSMWIGMA